MELSERDDSEIQCLVCTHSMQLIDRAPVHTLNLIRGDDDGNRKITRLEGMGDESDYTDFLNDVGRSIGLSNSALLYERGFFIVEGESEALAVPIIYRNIFKRDMRDDGIILINLYSCSAWKSALDLLLGNRRDVVHFLFDTDCTDSKSSGYMSDDTLERLKCPPNFKSDHVTYIGTTEFEDAFHNDLLHAALCDHYEIDSDEWTVHDIELLRHGAKFSENLLGDIRNRCAYHKRNSVRKPFICEAIARKCVLTPQVPNALLVAFERIRQRVLQI